MISGLDLASIRFEEPQWLWLLIAPLLLLVVWVRQVARRQRDLRRFLRVRQVPVRQRFPLFGDSLFWLSLIIATTLLLTALARPGVVVSLVRKGGVDLVVLLDGSASMHVKDVAGNRWQRSIRFLRVLGDSLRWEESDRIALTVFAHVASPQVRLTKDPNTLFFFMDHLADEPPFPLEDDATWDTNIELGLYWGMRLIDRDADLSGASTNAPLFVLITDGQAWSGTVEESLKLARRRNIPVYVVGVGTIAGGFIPEPPRPATATTKPVPPPVYSILDRGSLRKIATTSGGAYLELDRDTDVSLANQIIAAGRRRVVALPPEPRMEDFHWRLLLAAGLVGLAGACFLRDRGEVWVQAAGGGFVLGAVAAFLV